MEKLNITKGEWEFRKSISPASENFKIVSKNNTGQEIKILAETFIHSRAGIGNISKEEMASNANLIVEAGNVANETGLTPRELQKQRDELLEALKKINSLFWDYSESSEGETNPYFVEVSDIAEEAIKKCS